MNLLKKLSLGCGICLGVWMSATYAACPEGSSYITLTNSSSYNLFVTKVSRSAGMLPSYAKPFKNVTYDNGASTTVELPAGATGKITACSNGVKSGGNIYFSTQAGGQNVTVLRYKAFYKLWLHGEVKKSCSLSPAGTCHASTDSNNNMNCSCTYQ